MKASMFFVLMTVMIDAIGIGLIIPVMPDLIREVNAGDLSQAALWGGILATVFAAMQFLFSPFIGGLSDWFGRRPVLLISLVVMAVDYVVMAIAGSIWLLVLARIAGGITAATHATANAVIADMSAPEDRAAGFGLSGAAFGVGFILGPLMGGFLAEYGTRAPFWAAAVLAGGNAVLGWIVLKETVTADNRRPFDWRRANPLGTLRHLAKLPQIRWLIVVYFLYQLAFAAYPSVWAYFGVERFGWTPAVIGMSLAIFGIAMVVVQAGLIRVALRWWGERRTVIAGHICAIVSYILLSFITSGTVALILTPLASLGGIILPALQGVMSRNIPANAQGELLGALSSASALAMIIAPLTMTAVFATFTDDAAPIYLPGAPFLLAAGLSVAGLALFILHSGTKQGSDTT